MRKRFGIVRLRRGMPAVLVFAALLPAALLLAGSAAAQDDSSQGIDRGNYNIQQTLEFGGRITAQVGNASIYNTFVNLHSGPRLYEQTLAMRSLNHQGLLFDNFYVSSFGYGGDPNSATRLRAYKNKIYDFSASFRRDVNYFNYDLLANPLNPTVSNPQLIVNNSLHLFDTVRRNTDIRMTLFPQSRVRFRMGYSRNISEGPSYSSIHEGTETQIFQDWKTSNNSYQFGIDFHLLPKTSFSYDQFVNTYKGDTSYVDRNFNFMLSNGVPADLGVAFNTPAGQPCAAPVSNAATTPPTASPTCNSFLSYSRTGLPRVATPTEQFSFESNYVPNLNLAGRFVYSDADNDVNSYLESLNGFISRSLQRTMLTSGVPMSRRLSVTADMAATYTVTSKLRIVDEFRFNNFRIPGELDFNQLEGFASSALSAPNTFSAATCPPPFTAATCPQHNSSSGADAAMGSYLRYLAEDSKYNTFRIEYDFTKRFGGYVGYRYGDRMISEFGATAYQAEVFDPGPTAAQAHRGDCAGATLPAGCTLQADGSVVFSGLTAASDTALNFIPVHEHSALIGLTARPTDALRMSADVELLSADNSFTRVSPRNLQHYKFRATYKPRMWMSFAGTVNVLESRDNVALVGNLQHNRNYGVSVALEPNDRLNVDMGYEYGNVFSRSDICFAIGSGVPTGLTACPVVSGTGPVSGISEYANTDHFVYFNVLVRPVHRVTATLGYALNSTSGNAPILDPTTGLPLVLNPNAPAGSLQYNYHKPSAAVSVVLAKNWTGRAAWGYYSYNEKAPPDPTGPRAFHANLVDLTVRYAF